MKDRLAIGVAATVGLLTVGGFTLYARHRNSPAPRVLGQKVVEDSLRRKVVRIAVEPSPAFLRQIDEGEAFEYRVAEPNGRVYVVRSNCDENTRVVDVPYAYGRPAVAPRLEVWAEQGVVGWTELGSLPPPLPRRLKGQSGAPVRAFHLTTEEEEKSTMGDPERMGPIRLASRNALPPDEYWTIDILESSLEANLGQSASVRAGPIATGDPDVARFHYAADVDALRVRVTRWKHRARAEKVILRGLRLIERDGQTVIDWKGNRIPNSLGVDLVRLPMDQNNPGFVQAYQPELERSPNPLRKIVGDQRSPTLLFSNAYDIQRPVNVSSSRLVVAIDDPWARLSTRFSMAFDHPDFHRLNLRRLTVGGATWDDPGFRPGPVERRPFDVSLILKREWNGKVGGFEATIPVESAPEETGGGRS